MAHGTIKKLIADKGFGFIEGERGDLFFHHSAVEGTSIETLIVGQEVTYEEGRGPKGPRARMFGLPKPPLLHVRQEADHGASTSGDRRLAV